MRVLVACASAHGSTTGIARRIGEVLESRGCTVDVVPIAADPDPGGYDAAVLGSAIHNQAWLPEATAFVQRHRDALRARPVWLFSAGMSAALPRPVRGAAHRAQDRRMAAALRDLVRPRGHRLFSGLARPEQFPGAVGRVARVLGVRFGDHRDWDAVASWAGQIAGELTAEHQDAPGRS
ncbi:flavodoxin domain-containing protein [Kocuria sp. LUK]|uniref:Flavodoxin n=1 Tax=Kocuria flava TaxID=446860 RepID=A0A2N4SZ09_9MICC|nr:MULTISPECIES: flavodoxin domain-containing protein [Kocuria]MCD1144697.1 flavodoxin domain-containing protein [Kocuria sp. LUK]PLC11217.1 flavodoxin [Kocuria flava]